MNMRWLGMLIFWAAPVLALAGKVDGTTLESVTWQLTRVVYADRQMHAVPDPIEVTATFAKGVVSGNGGCNRYTASYVVDGGKLTIGSAATTMMACPEPQTSIEQPFMSALAMTMGYKIEGGQLTLLDAGGQAIAVFKVQQPMALKGVTWRATVYNNGRGGAVALMAYSAGRPAVIAIGRPTLLRDPP